jgi:dihydroorotase
MSTVGQRECSTQGRVVGLFRDRLDYTYLGNLRDRADYLDVLIAGRWILNPSSRYQKIHQTAVSIPPRHLPPAHMKMEMHIDTLIAVLISVSILLAGCTAPTYDVVIANGRVMDPETGFDQIAHVGINGGRIEAIDEEPLRGETTIDAAGLVVAPGFIELHTHGHDSLNYRYRAMDGVTMMLDTEKGTEDVDAWYAEREGRTIVHHGTTAGHGPARVQVMDDEYHGFHFFGPARTKVATPAEREAIVSIVREGLSRGAIGVGMTLQYTPAATEEEVAGVFEAAAEVPGAVNFVHMRYIGLGTDEQPSSVDGLDEILAVSEQTGVPLHVCHVTSSGLAATTQLLEQIDAARANGQDVTTELYPYQAAMSGINSTWFEPGWQELLGISYDRLQWPATGEFLTEETFERFRREHEHAEVIMHMIPDEAFEAALESPHTMIVSDGLIFPELIGHPRSTGTSARVVGRLARDEGLLTMMDAIRKMTLLPAQRLEARVPDMQRKGRVQVGADADLTIFDPEEIIDASTYTDPIQYSEGVEYVFVSGVPIVLEGELQEGVAPGRPIRASVAED